MLLKDVQNKDDGNIEKSISKIIMDNFADSARNPGKDKYEKQVSASFLSPDNESLPNNYSECFSLTQAKKLAAIGHVDHEYLFKRKQHEANIQ